MGLKTQTFADVYCATANYVALQQNRGIAPTRTRVRSKPEKHVALQQMT